MVTPCEYWNFEISKVLPMLIPFRSRRCSLAASVGLTRQWTDWFTQTRDRKIGIVQVNSEQWRCHYFANLFYVAIVKISPVTWRNSWSLMSKYIFIYTVLNIDPCYTELNGLCSDIKVVSFVWHCCSCFMFCELLYSCYWVERCGPVVSTAAALYSEIHEFKSRPGA
jgi:hypothetical protein